MVTDEYDEQIEYELGRVIAQRMNTIEAEREKWKKAKIVLIVTAIVLAVLFLVLSIIRSAYHGELRNMATDDIDERFTNVYADVVSIEPMYFIYSNDSVSYGTKYGKGDLWNIICKCKTIEGKTVWAEFFYQYYPDGDYSGNEDDYKSFIYPTDTPVRLIGEIDTARQVLKKLEDDVGNVFVLDVEALPN